ncbi:MAG: hypothetical protein CMF27_06455 [Kiritimatiellaceae bacterium]|jgi:putative salt-induced outer membrane protein YdiY|nr:hypothetical protein [Kiritimatiellaceae bacterium]|tara:strand:+ start:12281 stop:13228 length:948 start_codon:yes stop_codon:yes gene_type:complete
MKVCGYALYFIIWITSISSAETVLFKNGDRINATSVEQTNDLLRITSDRFGIILINKNELQPTPTPPVKKLPLKKPTPKKTSKWSGQISASQTSRDLNTIQQRNDTIAERKQKLKDTRIHLKLNYVHSNHEFSWDAKHRYYYKDRKIDDQYTLTQIYKRNIPRKKYYTSFKSMYQTDFRRAIEHEYLQTAEVGIDWKKTKEISLSTSVGIAYHKYNRSIISNNESIDQNVELPKAVFNEKMRWQIIENLALVQTYSHQGDFDNYQFNFSGGIENRLIKELFIKFEYKIEEDTEVNYDDKGFYNRSFIVSLLHKFK